MVAIKYLVEIKTAQKNVFNSLIKIFSSDKYFKR